jgi:hypothetical protein
MPMHIKDFCNLQLLCDEVPPVIKVVRKLFQALSSQCYLGCRWALIFSRSVIPQIQHPSCSIHSRLIRGTDLANPFLRSQNVNLLRQNLFDEDTMYFLIAIQAEVFKYS